jgi:predicted RNA-binding protein YlqC (UPF0109 family)
LLESAALHLVRGIVDNPDDVQVANRSTPRGDVIEIRVTPADLGRVSGRAGRTAKAVRTVVSSLADGARVRVDIVDTDS